jgi:hypothetical protein
MDTIAWRRVWGYPCRVLLTRSSAVLARADLVAYMALCALL